jgi:hypothetical protein
MCSAWHEFLNPHPVKSNLICVEIGKKLVPVSHFSPKNLHIKNFLWHIARTFCADSSAKTEDLRIY